MPALSKLGKESGSFGITESSLGFPGGSMVCILFDASSLRNWCIFHEHESLTIKTWQLTMKSDVTAQLDACRFMAKLGACVSRIPVFTFGADTRGLWFGHLT